MSALFAVLKSVVRCSFKISENVLKQFRVL